MLPGDFSSPLLDVANEVGHVEEDVDTRGIQNTLASHHRLLRLAYRGRPSTCSGLAIWAGSVYSIAVKVWLGNPPEHQRYQQAWLTVQLLSSTEDRYECEQFHEQSLLPRSCLASASWSNEYGLRYVHNTEILSVRRSSTLAYIISAVWSARPITPVYSAASKICSRRL